MIPRRIGQVFTVPLSAVAVSAAQDVFEIATTAETKVRIREIRLGQYSDAGDAQAELLSVLIMRGHTTTGSGGTTPTPVNVSASTVAATSTVKANNTTVATGGSPVTIYADAWNVQAGWWYAPAEAEMPIVDVSSRVVVRITAPVDAITFNATVVFEELGTLMI